MIIAAIAMVLFDESPYGLDLPREALFELREVHWVIELSPDKILGVNEGWVHGF
jgi:hypothetical protein